MSKRRVVGENILIMLALLIGIIFIFNGLKKYQEYRQFTYDSLSQGSITEPIEDLGYQLFSHDELLNPREVQKKDCYRTLSAQHSKKTSPYRVADLYKEFPENRMFVAIYLASLPSLDLIETPKFADTVKSLAFKKENAERLALLEYAKKIDPDNGLYNYMTAIVLRRSALSDGNEIYENKHNYNHDPDQIRRYKDHYFYKLQNAHQFKKVIEEIQKGMQKKRFSTYSQKFIINLQKAVSPQIHDLLSFSKTIYIPPHLLGYRSIRECHKILYYYVEYLYDHGKIAEAQKIVESYPELYQKLEPLNNELLWIKWMIYFRAMDVSDENSRRFYTTIKNNEKAEYFTKKEDANIEFNKWRFSELIADDNKIIKKHGGFYSRVNEIFIKRESSAEEFLQQTKPERMVEYKILEQLLIVPILLILIVIFLASLLNLGENYLVLKYFKKQIKISNSYIKPTKKDFLKIIIYGSIVPFLIYLLVINCDVLSGRNLNVIANQSRFILQNLFFIVSLIVPLRFFYNRFFIKYCRQNNIVCRNLILEQLNWFILYIGALFLAIFPLEITLEMVVFVGLYFALVLLIFKFNCSILGKKREQFVPFIWLRERNFISYLIVVPVVICGINYTISHIAENYYFQRDTIIFSSSLLKNYNNAPKLSPEKFKNSDYLGYGDYSTPMILSNCEKIWLRKMKSMRPNSIDAVKK